MGICNYALASYGIVARIIDRTRNIVYKYIYLIIYVIMHFFQSFIIYIIYVITSFSYRQNQLHEVGRQAHLSI